MVFGYSAWSFHQSGLNFHITCTISYILAVNSFQKRAMSKISLYFYPVIHTVTLVARITGTVSENIVSTCTIEEQLPSFSLFLEFKMFEFI